jgi:hypothetical protein
MKKAGWSNKTKELRKVGKVMHEFKEGTLHSGKSDKIVKNPKQAIAIALSEAGLSKKATGGMVLSNNEIIKNIDFDDNTDIKHGRYDFYFQTEDSEGADMLDYDGYIIEAPASSRMNDEIEWGQNTPEDWENAEKILIDAFYEWKNNKKATGGGVREISTNELDKVREKVNSFLNPLGYSARVEKSIGDTLYIIEPSTKKVGKNRSDFFDGMQILAFQDGTFEVSEYQAGENENELYIYKETNSLTNALKDLIKGNKRKPIRKYAKGGGLVETVLWATKKGEPDWAEQMITDKPDRIEDAKKWALANGFDRIRISKIDMSEKPDFTKVFNKKETGGGVKKIDGVSFNRLQNEFRNEKQIFEGEVVDRGTNKFKINDNKFYIKRPNEDWEIFREIKYANGGEVDINDFDMPVIRSQFEEEEFEYGNGGGVDINDWDLPVIHTQFEEEEFEYGGGGAIFSRTMKTPDGTIVGKVDYNDFWKTYQVVIDGVVYEEFKTKEEAIQNLKNAGFGKMQLGGGIPNNYFGKTPEEVWNEWTETQRLHFLIDHRLTDLHSSKIMISFSELPESIKRAVKFHRAEGQYAGGGEVDINDWDLPIIRTQFEDEEYEFEKGGEITNEERKQSLKNNLKLKF